MSEYWSVHGAATIVAPRAAETLVLAGFAFGGPADRLRPRSPLGGVRLWRRLANFAGRVLVASEQMEAAIRRDRARKAFRPGPVVDETLSALPPYAELAVTRPLAQLALLRYATYVNELVPRVQGAQRTLEIGSGAGLLSLGLHRLVGSQSVLVDLPEMLAVAFSVLAHYEGDAAITLPNEVGSKLPDTPYVLLTPAQVELVPDRSVDLAINTDSFQEMTYQTIGGYFELLRRVLRPGGLVYCVNETVCTKVPDAPIEFARYPWPDEWETVVDRRFDYSRLVMGYDHRERLSRVPA